MAERNIEEQMELRQLYIDMTESNNCTSYCMKEVRMIQAGATVYSMSVSSRNEEYQKLADAYDMHFIFDDMNVKVDFYTVPRIDIMAVDSQNGYIATVGEMSNFDSDAPICYIDQDRHAYLIAKNARELIANIASWRTSLIPYDGIRFFQTKEEAQKVYEFLDMNSSAAAETANQHMRST